MVAGLSKLLRTAARAWTRAAHASPRSSERSASSRRLHAPLRSSTANEGSASQAAGFSPSSAHPGKSLLRPSCAAAPQRRNRFRCVPARARPRIRSCRSAPSSLAQALSGRPRSTSTCASAALAAARCHAATPVSAAATGASTRTAASSRPRARCRYPHRSHRGRRAQRLSAAAQSRCRSAFSSAAAGSHGFRPRPGPRAPPAARLSASATRPSAHAAEAARPYPRYAPSPVGRLARYSRDTSSARCHSPAQSASLRDERHGGVRGGGKLADHLHAGHRAAQVGRDVALINGLHSQPPRARPLRPQLVRPHQVWHRALEAPSRS